MNEKSAPSMHLGYLDGLRAVAALYVVLHHASIQTPVSWETLPSTGRVALRLLGYGHYAVDLFIVLSGFCLMLPVSRGNGFMRHDAMEFMKRRAIRIVPPYYLAIALSLLLIHFLISKKMGTIWDASIPITAKSLVTHFLLIQDLFGEAHSLNYPLWSVSVEWRIYFFFPLLVWTWRQAGPIWAAGTAVMCSYGLLRLGEFYFHDAYSFHYLGLFAMGMLGADIVFSSRLEKFKGLPWDLVTLLSVPTILFISTIKPYHGDLLPLEFRDYIVGFGSMALLITVSLKPSGLVHRMLSYKPLVFIGCFAYSIYLIHAPLLQVTWLALPMLQSYQWWMFAVQTVVGIPVIVGISYLFFWCCERPFLTRNSKRNRSMIVKTVLEPAP